MKKENSTRSTYEDFCKGVGFDPRQRITDTVSIMPEGINKSFELSVGESKVLANGQTVRCRSVSRDNDLDIVVDGLPENWVVRFVNRPVMPHTELGLVDHTPEGYRAALDKLAEDGRMQGLPHIPAGWVPLARFIVDTALNAVPDVRIRRMKEKWAKLDVHFDLPENATGYQVRFIEDLQAWVEEVSSQTCAIFGTPDAEVVEVNDWDWSLSPRAWLMGASAVDKLGFPEADAPVPPAP